MKTLSTNTIKILRAGFTVITPRPDVRRIETLNLAGQERLVPVDVDIPCSTNLEVKDKTKALLKDEKNVLNDLSAACRRKLQAAGFKIVRLNADRDAIMTLNDNGSGWYTSHHGRDMCRSMWDTFRTDPKTICEG